MNRTKIILPAIIIGLIIIGGIWFITSWQSADDKIEGVSKLSDVLSSTGQASGDVIKPKTESGESGFFSRIFKGDETYRDIKSGFSFKYQKDYSIKEIPAPAEGEARTLLLSKEGQAPSAQVAITPFDEDIVLTVERIQADVPDLAMKNPQAVLIGSVTKGVKFDSDTGVNIWFVAKGNLFQLTAFSGEAAVLDQIVSSFKI